MCELVLPPPSTSHRRAQLHFDDKCAVVRLMQTVASCGELSGDSTTLALLPLIDVELLFMGRDAACRAASAGAVVGDACHQT